jgi:flagellar basal-body rod protein FlgG
MIEGLYSAAAGMAAQQEQLNAISNDLANVSTAGYKSERVAFSDLLYNNVNMAGTVTADGSGASAHTIGRSEAEGSIQDTGDPLDLAIEGNGFFAVSVNGHLALTRDGTFGVDAKGTIVNSDGNPLSPPIKLPKGVSPSEVQISPGGTVAAGKRTLGHIKLLTVTSPEHLLANGSGQLTPTAASGSPHAATKARILQGGLESSNVNVGSEMALMMSTQRNYQLTSSAIQTESQMMSIANQLRTP